MELCTLQSYWWLLVSVLGAFLVFLLFVQGGQSILCSSPSPESKKSNHKFIRQKMGAYLYNSCRFWWRIFCFFPSFLLNQFWRRLLAMDANSS